jgi:aminoglycoside phosphotransferase (APT) family kinase protein
MDTGDPASARLETGFEAWMAERGSFGSGATVRALARPPKGHSSNTYLVEVSTSDASDAANAPSIRRLVLRLPPDHDVHHGDNLLRQVRVQNLLAEHGIPAASPAVLEADAGWIGSPFVTMPCVEGHVAAEVPVLDEWITGAPVARQASIHRHFAEAVASVHALDWRSSGISDVVRGAGDTLDDDVDHWLGYLDWATEGHAPARLVDLLGWCRASRPDAEPPRSLLWGDVRLGNVIFDDDGEVRALIDWETACIGPAELDVGYWLGLDAVIDETIGSRVEGFPTRAETLARHEELIGRPLVAMDWFEVLGLASAACITVRLTVIGGGRPPSDAALARNPVILRMESIVTGR